jgi:predicted phage terminase large subunit-like protein
MARADGIYYVEDIVRGQWSSHTRDDVMLRTARADAARFRSTGAVEQWTEEEPGSSGKDSAAATVRLLAGFAVKTERVTGSKEVRAEPFAAQAEAGNVRLVRAPWNSPYVDELTSFPTGRYDDQVDGSSGAFNRLAEALGKWVVPEVDALETSLIARLPPGVFGDPRDNPLVNGGPW